MATVILVPNADVSNDWALSGLGDAQAHMSTGHTGTIATDPLFLWDAQDPPGPFAYISKPGLISGIMVS